MKTKLGADAHIPDAALPAPDLGLEAVPDSPLDYDEALCSECDTVTTDECTTCYDPLCSECGDVCSWCEVTSYAPLCSECGTCHDSLNSECKVCLWCEDEAT